MLPNVRNTAIATITALALAASAAAPAHAFSKGNRNLVQGLAAVAIIGTIIHQSNKRNSQTTRSQSQYYAPQPQPQYYAPQPRYQEPQTRYQAPQSRYQEPQTRYQAPQSQGRIIPNPTTGSTLYQTPAAQAFNAYNRTERRLIQQRLAAYGYYGGAIDGSFGPGTYRAISAYAQRGGAADRLGTQSGAYAIYDALIS
ncbi:MAG: peptidoglycan-binding protein [Paracoccaceae bacterium]|nr:peptidoglycan-binding protein [Paracoccaceae bacterium]